jgi:hypothetical protein
MKNNTGFRVGKLECARDALREQCKNARRAVHGQISAQEASCINSIFASIRTGFEQYELEQRMAALESNVERLLAARTAPVLLNSYRTNNEPKQETREARTSIREASSED